MKYFLKIVLLSIISGIACSVFSVIVGTEKGIEWWFLFGSCSCFFTVGYVESLATFFTWWRSQPDFKGFKYWIREALGIEYVKREQGRENK